MKIQNEKMNSVSVVVRSKSGNLLGLVTFKLAPALFVDMYKVDEFIVDGADGNLTTSEDYPLDIQEKIENVTIDFSSKDDRAEVIADIAGLFFSDLGIIIFNFENDEISSALGGEFIF